MRAGWLSLTISLISTKADRVVFFLLCLCRLVFLFFLSRLKLRGNQLLICPLSHQLGRQRHDSRRSDAVTKLIRCRDNTGQESRSHRAIDQTLVIARQPDGQAIAHLRVAAQALILPTDRPQGIIKLTQVHGSGHSIMEDLAMAGDRGIQLISTSHTNGNNQLNIKVTILKA